MLVWLASNWFKTFWFSNLCFEVLHSYNLRLERSVGYLLQLRSKRRILRIRIAINTKCVTIKCVISCQINWILCQWSLFIYVNIYFDDMSECRMRNTVQISKNQMKGPWPWLKHPWIYWLLLDYFSWHQRKLRPVSQALWDLLAHWSLAIRYAKITICSLLELVSLDFKNRL